MTVALSYLAPVAMAENADSPQATLIAELGKHNYPAANSSKRGQAFFNQGLLLYYAFHFPESLASFREAARLDPDCAMHHWGQAIAIAPNANSRYLHLPDDPLGHGARAINRARQLKANATEKEQALIDALFLLYDDEGQPIQDKRTVVHAAAMRAIHEKYPDDPDVAVLHAAAQMMVRPWSYFAPDGSALPGTQSALHAIEGALKRDINHAGANHLFIHLVENGSRPEAALPHALRLSKSFPLAGHLVHMPSHIYIRMGSYAKVIECNQHSVEADKQFLQAWGNVPIPVGSPSYPLSATNHRMHAIEFLHAAAIWQGHYERAMQAANWLAHMSKPHLNQGGMTQRGYIKPMLTEVRFGKWDQILKAPAKNELPPFVLAIQQYAMGRALVASGRLDEAEDALAEVRRIANMGRLSDVRVRVNSGAQLLELASCILSGALHARQDEMEEAIAEFAAAVRLEDGLNYMEPSDWGHPARYLLGAALLAADRPAEAEVVYWEDLRRHPNNGWALHGVVQCQRAQGRESDARETQQRFEDAWKDSDTPIDTIRPW